MTRIRNISANLTEDMVERVQTFQSMNGIKHFSDALQVYVESLERGTIDR